MGGFRNLPSRKFVHIPNGSIVCMKNGVCPQCGNRLRFISFMKGGREYYCHSCEICILMSDHAMSIKNADEEESE
jgi:MinD superfamily P-loop ATPase